MLTIFCPLFGFYFHYFFEKRDTFQFFLISVERLHQAQVYSLVSPSLPEAAFNDSPSLLLVLFKLLYILVLLTLPEVAVNELPSFTSLQANLHSSSADFTRSRHTVLLTLPEADTHVFGFTDFTRNWCGVVTQSC